ncbi:AbiJ-NTD4 domain-containing protein [Bergeyella zoohelcum]|uniref:HEPN AbiJ-N-terminal domain-containing protein n=1 Tax=Bergeyella zoohelcum ATCC 43767 TaxID=883096 RepID=K1LUT1_9FLAO|nr:hypothetical protein [Bergeyella zoohelcum]EKB55932.1 hypothetical protein HMPREF9699_01577 [Bergeyella zoohelcum ATCC 43767]SUV50344.1 Uncharacterised protein [Bergeyella zoohelcum]
MSLFSERYGYTKPSEVIIREKITPEIQNAICSCFDKLRNRNSELYKGVEKSLWTYFLNQREGKFWNNIVATSFIEDSNEKWYRKLDIIEFTIELLNFYSQKYGDAIKEDFITELNFHFERLNFAYRIVENKILEITSEEEIKTIENAIEKSENNVAKHLSKALELYAVKPQGDYQNSIKESISAVEAYLREKTGEQTLGKALKKLKEANIIIPQMFENACTQLYAYTNQKETGIRHALMKKESNYVPTEREAYFMLIFCSAFINYLQGK